MKTNRLQLVWQIAIAALRARLRPRPARLAIFAGAGELPLIAARTARERGSEFFVYHITEADLNAELAADASMTKREVSLGDIGKTIQLLQQDKITQVILLGKVEKQRLLQDVKRDSAAEEIYNRAADRRDDTLFLQFAALLATIGIEILKQKDLLPGCFLPRGIHTKKQPEDKALLEDIAFGYELSRKVGSLDIGQTAVVFQKMVLAVEAIEGTDAAILRAGAIIRGQGSLADAHPAQDGQETAPDTKSVLAPSVRTGGVVCKTGKASQDPRFDLPAVGLRTLESMKQAGMQCLVIEAAQTLVVNPKEFIAHADALGLIVVAR